MLSPLELTRKLKRSMIEHDDPVPDGPEMIDDLVDGLVTVDPENVPQFPSVSRNNVHFFGCERTVTEQDVDRVISFYERAGVSRFYFWLSPNDQLPEIVQWLAARGGGRWTGTGYPTLLRDAQPLPDHTTDLEVRQVDRAEAERYRSDISRIYADPRFKPIFVETCGTPNQYHYLAFDGDRAVSAGILFVSGDLASLGWMATAEQARGRGGQSAMIVARVNRAAEIGCKWVCGSTLTALASSLANMQRKGFEIVFERLVYGFGVDSSDR